MSATSLSDACERIMLTDPISDWSVHARATYKASFSEEAHLARLLDVYGESSV